MTPKEKAEQLVWQYSRALQLWDKENSLKAIQCALIAVDEIIDSLTIKNYSDVDNYEYWNKVKYEIENL